jgi:hypothetical protein
MGRERGEGISFLFFVFLRERERGFVVFGLGNGWMDMVGGG